MELYQRHFQAYWKLRRWYINYVEAALSGRNPDVTLRVLRKLHELRYKIKDEMFIDYMKEYGNGTCNHKVKGLAGKDVRFRFLDNGILWAKIVDLG